MQKIATDQATEWARNLATYISRSVLALSFRPRSLKNNFNRTCLHCTATGSGLPDQQAAEMMINSWSDCSGMATEVMGLQCLWLASTSSFAMIFCGIYTIVRIFWRFDVLKYGYHDLKCSHKCQVNIKKWSFDRLILEDLEVMQPLKWIFEMSVGCEVQWDSCRYLWAHQDDCQPGWSLWFQSRLLALCVGEPRSTSLAFSSKCSSIAKW